MTVVLLGPHESSEEACRPLQHCDSAGAPFCISILRCCPAHDGYVLARLSAWCLALLQVIDSIPLVPQLGRLLAKSSGGRGSGVQGKPPLSGWAKAQALMIYSKEHDERWVHNGFLQVLGQSRMPGHIMLKARTAYEIAASHRWHAAPSHCHLFGSAGDQWGQD